MGAIFRVKNEEKWGFEILFPPFTNEYWMKFLEYSGISYNLMLTKKMNVSDITHLKTEVVS